MWASVMCTKVNDSLASPTPFASAMVSVAVTVSASVMTETAIIKIIIKNNRGYMFILYYY
jgi:hypothetical protein